MAYFLRGRFKGFYPAGSSACVRDMFRIRKINETTLYLEQTRRDQETLLGRFWRYENSFIKLYPVDEKDPRLGGSVKVTGFFFNFQTMTFGFKNQYGVYGDNFITFGSYVKSGGNPLVDEERLLKIVEENPNNISDQLVDKTTFELEDSYLFYSREVNPENGDVEVNHPIPKSKLEHFIPDSWTEALFYGVGNKQPL